MLPKPSATSSMVDALRLPLIKMFPLELVAVAMLRLVAAEMDTPLPTARSPLAAGVADVPTAKVPPEPVMESEPLLPTLSPVAARIVPELLMLLVVSDKEPSEVNLAPLPITSQGVGFLESEAMEIYPFEGVVADAPANASVPYINTCVWVLDGVRSKLMVEFLDWKPCRVTVTPDGINSAVSGVAASEFGVRTRLLPLIAAPLLSVVNEPVDPRETPDPGISRPSKISCVTAKLVKSRLVSGVKPLVTPGGIGQVLSGLLTNMPLLTI